MGRLQEPAVDVGGVLLGPPGEWLVLRCSAGRTMALAAALAERGAWVPTWKRKRRKPRTNFAHIVDEPCLPSFVFVPARGAHDLPTLPRIPYSFMRIDGALVRIADRELEPLRRVAQQPLVAASKLPRPGEVRRFSTGPFQGLRAKIIACTQRYCSVTVDGFSQPLQVPPSILQKKGA